MLLIWQLPNRGPLCQRPLNMAQTKTPLSRVFFRFSSIWTKCWVLWFFLKHVRNFDNLPSMKFSIWIYMILSKTFDLWHWQAYSFLVFLSKSSFLLKVRVTSATFSSSRKHPFWKDELIIFVRRETWASIVDFNNFAGISSTRLALEPSGFEIFSGLLFCYLIKRKWISHIKDFLNFQNTCAAFSFILYTLVGVS